MWLRYNPQIIFVAFLQVELIIFSGIIYDKVNGQGILWAKLLLQFYADSFETSLVFWSWSEDMHVVWIKSSEYIYHIRGAFSM